MRGWLFDFSVLASTLGIDRATLKSDLHAGQAIAQSRKVDDHTIINNLKASLQAKLNKVVSSGNLTSANEQQLLANFGLEAQKILSRTGVFNGGHVKWQGSAPSQEGTVGVKLGRFTVLQYLTSVLNIDSAMLEADLQSGQSIADIAQSKGVQEQTLIANLQTAFQTKLNQAVANGELTSEQEQKILANFSSHVTQFVEHKGGFRTRLNNSAQLQSNSSSTD